MRPTASYDPLDDEHPFLLVSGEDGKVQQWLTRSVRRALALDLERAAEEDREACSCLGDHHVFRVAEAQPLTPPGAVAVTCANCPATGVLEAGGDVVPVEGSDRG